MLPKAKKVAQPKNTKPVMKDIKMEEVKEEVKMEDIIPQIIEIIPPASLPSPELLKKKSSGPRQKVLYKVNDCLLVEDLVEDKEEMKNEEEPEKQ